MNVLAAAGDDSANTGLELTPRQSEVLTAVARGLSNPDVAAELGVSESTVRTHLRVMFRTLGVRSRTEAAAEARRIGLID